MSMTAPVHVIGPSGTEGSAVIDYLVRRGGSTITAHDLARGPEEFAEAFRRTHQWLSAEDREVALVRLLEGPATIHFRDRYLEGINRAGLIVVPQSWFRHPENEPLKVLKAAGVPFTSMTRLFFETCPAPIIGVTGTNGKFTVATLIHQMLEEAGRTAFISGNDRTHVPMLYFLDQITPQAWLVLEISNRQLVDLERSPHIGVITNLAPHHLDDHGSMEAYARVKADLIRYQRPGDHAVLNRDNRFTRGMAGETPARVAWFSVDGAVDRGAYLKEGTLRLALDSGGAAASVLELSELALPGRPMVENALAACAAAGIAGVPPDTMGAVLRRFRGLPYRFRRLGRFGDLSFYEDSLATNPTAAAAAIGGMRGPFFLIAGGFRRAARAEDFQPMMEALRAAGGECRGVMLIGSTAPVLAEAVAALPAAARPEIVSAGTLERAMAEIAHRGRAGDAVLLSPGCESFDQFADYRQRGDRFAALAEEFAREGAKLPDN